MRCPWVIRLLVVGGPCRSAGLVACGGWVVVDVRGVWGKLGSGAVSHPLVCHALDTAVVAEGLLGVLVGPHGRGELERAFGPLGDAAGWVSVLCGLHDVGKASPAFQGLRQDVAVAALGPVEGPRIERLVRWRDPGARTDCHHGVLTAVQMVRLLRSWGAGPATARSIAWALGGHHGVVPSAASVRQAREAVGDHGGAWWAAVCDALVGRVVSLWGLGEPGELPWGDVRLSPEAVVALAGLTSVSDWIASARPEKTYAGPHVDLAAYLGQARVAEARKVEKLAWRPWQPLADTSFAALFPDEARPHPVQAAVESVVAGMREPGIVVVAAPTGEGKTKAALQAAAAMVRRFSLRGFYVAMPSRVTSNQAFETVGGATGGSGGGGAGAAAACRGRRVPQGPSRSGGSGRRMFSGALSCGVSEWFTLVQLSAIDRESSHCDRCSAVARRGCWAAISLTGLPRSPGGTAGPCVSRECPRRSHKTILDTLSMGHASRTTRAPPGTYRPMHTSGARDPNPGRR
ncbi:CRISPR-associated endonuclease Cas3-HD [Streptomyces sp. SAI-135]|nr:CRISPR-associated endonuclease Cas3-HD [Streptomyces sp. SAI-090]MDH6554204.1 CRISPR-associated endonuclease Cas3-HD [Streptomyces sp. SAI-041]MDH6581798.1 CRISPR-associated endonuclease Cas3-HD [Streptomyces sp. SAI-133]MDH6613801.1 CRISPR-associated endonuclease Cas3-HD [Streptomyces sp. SAI-135]